MPDTPLSKARMEVTAMNLDWKVLDAFELLFREVERLSEEVKELRERLTEPGREVS